MASHIVKTREFASGHGTKIVFEPEITYIMSFSDFSESYLTGTCESKELLKNKNFLQSKLENLNLTGMDFDGSDFLDSIITGSQFKNCLFTRHHFTSSKFENVNFIDSELSESTQQNSTFVNCKFLRCNFHNFLMKSCTFINCIFIECDTTNKLFESCLLLSCQFENIELQTQTVIENFGLNRHQCKAVLFRDKRKREKYISYSIEDMCSKEINLATDHVGKFLYNYFCDEISLKTYESLFLAIEEHSWIGKGASHTVTTKIENLSTFLIFLYENNDIFFLPILLLNDLISDLIHQLESLDTLETKSMSRTLFGVKHQLAAKVATFIKYINLVVTIQFNTEGEISIIAQGPLECSFYQPLFSTLGTDCEITDVKLQNSPNIVKATVKNTARWAFVALILSTQYEHKLTDISGNIVEGTVKKQQNLEQLVEPGSSITLPDNIENLKNFELSIGPLNTGSDEIGFQMVSIFTNGMTEKLKLSISPKRALELHKTILGFSED